MKTDKNRTRLKDRQRVDVRVLGQILAAQNIDFVLPDVTHITEFFAETLVTIPGISSCRVCLQGVTVQKGEGEMDTAACKECPVSRIKEANREDISPFMPDIAFTCRLGEQPGIRSHAIVSPRHHFGFFIFKVNDLDVFNVYQPFIGNLANYVALSLENRLQRELLQQSQAELERKVEERTRDLIAANTQLKDEVETRRRTENALRLKELQIRQLIEASPVAMLAASGDDQHAEFVNEKFTELFGYTIEEIPDPEHWWPLAYPDEDYREKIKALWKAKTEPAIRDRGQIEPVEAVVRCKDGTHRHVEFRLSSIGEKHLITLVDLTDRKQAEEELRERERHSQSLLRLSKRLEQAQTYMEALNAAQDEVREIVGYKNLWAYLITEDKQYAHSLVASGPLENVIMSENGTATLRIKGDRMLEEIVESKDIVVVEDAQTDDRVNKEIVTQLGNRTIVNIPIILFDKHLGSVGTGTYGDEGIRVPTASERQFLMALASHMAVTFDRIHLLMERRKIEQELAAREREYRVLLENIPDLIVRYNADLRRVYVNPAWEKASGLSSLDVVHVDPANLPRVPNPINSEYLEKLQQVLATGVTQTIEFTWVNAHGETLYLDYVIVPEYDQAGTISGVLSVGRDLTERNRAEENLRASEEKFRAIIEQSAEGILLADEDGLVVEWNHADEAMTGLKRDQVLGRPLWDVMLKIIAPERITVERREAIRSGILEALRTGKSRLFDAPVEMEFYPLSSKEKHYIHQTIFPIRTEKGYRIASLIQDITDRKRAEEALRESEYKLGEAARIAHVGYWDRDYAADTINLSEEACHIFGLPLQYRFSRLAEWHPQWLNLIHPDDQPRVTQILNRALAGGPPYNVDYRVIRPNGEVRNVHSFAELTRDESGKPLRMFGTMIDITERIRAEAERQTHLRFLESMDQINRAIQKTDGFEQMASEVLDITLSLFNCDRAFLLYPCDPEAASWFSPMERTRPEYPGVLALGFDEIPMDAEVSGTLRLLLESDGPVKFGPGNPYPLPSDVSERFNIKSFMSMAIYPKVDKPWQFGIHQCSHHRTWASEDERLFQEIGRRLTDALTSLLAHRNLQESELRYRQIFENTSDIIVITEVTQDGRFVQVASNPAWEKVVGLDDSAVLGKPFEEFAEVDETSRVVLGRYRECVEKRAPLDCELELVTPSGHWYVDTTLIPLSNAAGRIYRIIGISRDITGRKKHEIEREAIVSVSTALRKAATRAEILTVILDQVKALFEADGSLLVMPNPAIGGVTVEMGRGPVGERFSGLNMPPGMGASSWVISNRKPYLNDHAENDPLFYRPDLLGDSQCVACVPLIVQERASGALWVVRKTAIGEDDLRLLNAIAEIAANAIHRVTLYEQTEQQLHHLMALHKIDLAISANFDLNITLNVIVSSVKDELQVDAASILLLDPITHTLNYAAGTGFRTHNIEQSRVKIGSGCAGRAAQEQRTISCPDLKQDSAALSRLPTLLDEDFAAHLATPLVVKGQVKGVLELFHRKSVEAGPDWFDYFETLAAQTAIAIENASLFENLQHSNSDLMLAYDATIEGWARALDLRDQETEGHTRRVAEMALNLAEKMGIPYVEKIDLWRGALLHDIGKMAIPDSILRKAGPLNQTEVEIMQRHPQYAYQMLFPITYLKNAMVIPYCHHEKWDGSGYPRGLKGDQIPLSARIFAVVDVYDALTSDRPYRAAWTQEETHRYIREQAGRHFDPQIVEIFLSSR
jgi:PAS domain S-box-containing protein/putative nucleotidyltransferase with HDIG domain